MFLLVGIGAAGAVQRGGSGGEYSLAQVKTGVCRRGRERRPTKERDKNMQASRQEDRQTSRHINKDREIGKDTSSRQEKRQIDSIVTKTDRSKTDTQS